MNKIIISGRFTKEHDIKYLENGTAVLSNTIASNRKFKDKNGEYKADFINIVLYGSQAKFIADYSNRGDEVLLEGRLQSRTYDKQDGTRVYITEVVGESVELLRTKKKETKEPQTQAEALDMALNQESDAYESFGNEVELSDDMLPF